MLKNTNLVKKIIKEVRSNGDEALAKYSRLFDKVAINNFKVTAEEFSEAKKLLKPALKRALLQALKNLKKFHNQQKLLNYKIEVSPGIVCEYQSRPIESVGLYVPGGSAPLISTVLMLGVPSEIAKCPQRFLCSPPSYNGQIHPGILFAAELCGINQVYKVGGAQAIAAMAYGTETIPKAYKIFGPGNQWVTLAKMLVANDIEGAIYDLPAGPSEVLVIADETSNIEFIAADLLSQAEHGRDSRAILITDSAFVIKEVKTAIKRQLSKLSRKDMIFASLKNSLFILSKNREDSICIANNFAPEHLILQIKNPRQVIKSIQSAGSVFIGPWSTESAGDYVSGTNHVLPTYAYAKSMSGLSVSDFTKQISFQTLSKAGLKSVSGAIKEIAGIEGLDAHWQAVAIRMGGV